MCMGALKGHAESDGGHQSARYGSELAEHHLEINNDIFELELGSFCVIFLCVRDSNFANCRQGALLRSVRYAG